MRRNWNWLLPLGFAVSLAAFLSYFLFFSQFPVTRDFPWLNLLFFAFALVLLGRGLHRAFRHPERYRGRIGGPIFALLSVAVLCFFVFYNFSLSKDLPASQGAPKIGQKAPDFTLPDKDGHEVTLSDLWQSDQNKWVLLVFYRGYW